MGYYCTVPQCTSLAGKTKNVKFHRFPRDNIMADKWNIILKRGKPYTKYSKVCSLHFTQADYNISTMGQWKTLNKDAVPSQNLPKLNPDGTVMVIRKSRTVKYKEQRKEEIVSDKTDKWMPLVHPGLPATTIPDRILPPANEPHDSDTAYRLQKLSNIANIISPHHTNQSIENSPPETHPILPKPEKQDAIMQTDPVMDEDEHTGYESSEKSYSPDMEQYQSQYKEQELYKEQEQFKDQEQFKEQEQYKDDYATKKFEMPKDYTKPAEDYIPQTNEEYNKEAEKYALERKSHNGYEKGMEFPKQPALENGYQKVQDMYQPEYEVSSDGYVFHVAASYADGADSPRGQHHNMQMLQEQRRINENQNFFNEHHIKLEIDFGNEEEKFLYERNKDQIEPNAMYESQRLLLKQQRLLQQLQHQVKQEPDAANGCESVMQPQTSPYYNTNSHTNAPGGYYEQSARPGPEMLIAKQNALAAHTQLWQNTMKRPFFYSETSHYNSPQLSHLHRYEDLTRIQQ